ncbi:MAG: hypothetical protein PHG60_00230 [Candidatus Dojkabacteria bacterium]|jgi:hypothetical protein|nr:hypothetical protein [Candidatus Dojkabacteria bacterium]MDD2270008.1 hypothetical protein [Candidatus Dojkabacteria bacterium]
MGKNITQVTGEDNVKRVKIMLLSFGIAFSLFFTKIFARGGGLVNIYLIGSIYALVAIVGLVWAFNFRIKIQSIKYIFQGGLFVFSEVVFVLLFFFKQFDRIYEGLLLVVLLMFLGVLTYVCFLMINIFNVSLFKELPLLNVAQTASYILTLLMIYFLTFGVLASGFPLYVIFPILFLIYIFLLHTEFNEIDIEKGHVWYLVIIVALLNVFLLLPFVFVGSSHEVIAVVPTIASFVGGGLLTIKERDNAKWQVFVYNFLILVIVFIAVYLSWF